MSTALAVVMGTVGEKMEAFRQMSAAASAGLFPAGYDTAPKVIAAAWAADSLGVHPVAYMQGVHVANFGGRTMLEPKWEFVHGLLKARLPGFKFKVIHKGDDYCELWFADGDGNEHTERYGWDDAVRQGFAGKDTYKTHKVEMLFKQCYKRGADVIGAHVLMGLPSATVEDDEFAANAPALPSPAVALDAAAASGAVVVDDGPSAAPALEPVSMKMLGAEVWRVWNGGKRMTNAETLAKVNLVMESLTGEPSLFKKSEEMGPADVRAVYDALRERYPEGGAPQSEATTAEQAQGETDGAAPPMTEDAPEADTVDPSPAQAASEAVTLDALSRLVKEAREKHPGRPFVMESPKGSGSFWFTDANVLAECGHPASVMLKKGDDVRVDFLTLTALVRAMQGVVA